MYQVIIVIHVLLALGIIGLIMIQQGKGADAGASFGAGASATVFGSQGAGSFLTRTTAIFATLFFTTSLGLAVIGGNQTEHKDIMAEQPATETPASPVIEMEKPEQALPQIPDASIPQTSVQEQAKPPLIQDSAKDTEKNQPEVTEKK